MMSPLKILHVLDHSLPFQSGYAFRTQNIFRAQFKKGWHPVGLTAPEHNKICKACEIGSETIGGFRYYRTTPVSDPMPPLVTQCRSMASVSRRIREVVAIEKPDLLHVHSPMLNAISALWPGQAVALP